MRGQNFNGSYNSTLALKMQGRDETKKDRSKKQIFAPLLFQPFRAFPRVGHGAGQSHRHRRCGSIFTGRRMVAFCAAGNNERVSKRRHRATGRSAMLPPGGPVGFRYGSKCGSKRFQRIKKRRQNIVDDRTDDSPVGILVMMHQPVPQARNFYPRNIGMLRLESSVKLAACSPML